MQISEIVDVANLCSGDRGCCKLVISEISEIGDVAKYDFVDVASLRFGRSWMLESSSCFLGCWPPSLAVFFVPWA